MRTTGPGKAETVEHRWRVGQYVDGWSVSSPVGVVAKCLVSEQVARRIADLHNAKLDEVERVDV